MPGLKFNVENFFNNLIFQPWNGAEKEDRNKALAASILFGLFTLAIGHTLVGIYQLGSYVWNKHIVNSEKTDSSLTNEKAHDVARRHKVVPQTTTNVESKNQKINSKSKIEPNNLKEEQTFQNRATFNDLYDEIITEIGHNLSVSDLNSLAQVCKSRRPKVNQMLIDRAVNLCFEKEPINVTTANKFLSELFKVVKVLCEKKILQPKNREITDTENILMDLKYLHFADLVLICMNNDEMYKLKSNLNITDFTKFISQSHIIQLERRKKIIKQLIRNIEAFDGLFEAALAADKYMVKLLLEQEVNPDYDAGRGYSSLHLAAQEGYIEITELLLKYGANINLKGKCGSTPLYFAISYNRFDLVKLLLDNGADSTICSGYSHLHLAAREGHIEITELLLKHGANINLKGDCGSTPLYFAVINNRLDIIKLLLDNGADRTIGNNEGDNPVSYCLKEGHFEITKLLSSYP